MSKKLDWLIKTNYSMNYEWCKIKKLHYKCPICNGNLFSTHLTFKRVMDGNAVIHCDNDEHTFYMAARSIETILYQNNNATETTFEYDKKFKYDYENKNWIEILE